MFDFGMEKQVIQRFDPIFSRNGSFFHAELMLLFARIAKQKIFWKKSVAMKFLQINR